MNKQNLKLTLFGATLTLILFAFIACRKNFQVSSEEEISSVVEAKAHLNMLVKSEESLLSLPFSILSKNSNLRRFARIGKIEKSAQWEKSKSFKRNNISYSIVPVNDNVHQLDNKSIESVRYLLFSKMDNDNMQMNIIEIYSRRDGSLGTNLIANLKTIVDNVLFNESRPIDNLNASIIFYDRYYYNVGSFMANNGIWKVAKIVVENNSRRPSFGSISSFSIQNSNERNLQKNLLSGLSPMSGCSVCTDYYLVGIWYDENTGQIVDFEILDTWKECEEKNEPPQGSPPGSTNPAQRSTKTPQGGGGGGDPAATKKITNNIDNPCLNALLNSIQSHIKDFVIDALNNEDIYRPMEFNYNSTTDFPDSKNGELVSMEQNTDGNFTYNLVLNANTLPDASKEYNLRTFMHEALHAVLLSKGIEWNGYVHHAEMANAYRNIMSNSLRSAFPNLSKEHADALSWEGLGTSPAFTNLPQSEKYRIGAILDDYRNQAKSGAGTPACK